MQRFAVTMEDTGRTPYLYLSTLFLHDHCKIRFQLLSLPIGEPFLQVAYLKTFRAQETREAAALIPAERHRVAKNTAILKYIKDVLS